MFTYGIARLTDFLNQIKKSVKLKHFADVTANVNAISDGDAEAGGVQ